GIDARVLFEEEITTTKLLWAPVNEATSYRVQIARDLSFTIQPRLYDLAGTSFVLKPDTKGLYVWRIASRSREGVFGEYGFARRIFIEAEEPKELLVG